MNLHGPFEHESVVARSPAFGLAKRLRQPTGAGQGNEGRGMKHTISAGPLAIPQTHAFASIPLPSHQPRLGRRQRRLHASFWGILSLLKLLLWAGAAPAQEFDTAFDQANRLYEQGKFTEAAAAYEQLVQRGHRSDTLFHNLGNAWFKAGQDGRAIAAYRQGLILAPRNPDLRFNLQFVRKKVTGSESEPGPAWRRWLGQLTLNEWTLLAMVPFGAWCGLQALAEARPLLRRALRSYSLALAVATVIFGGCLAAAVYSQAHIRDAVVITPSAVVRYGPLEESQVFSQLPNGSEVTVLDEKKLDAGATSQVWLQIRDVARRTGWVKSDQVLRWQPRR
jgi:tetratricopeptide (TPR) repeat protein